MLPKDCTMSAKSFSKSNPNYLARVGLVFAVVVITSLFILVGRERTTPKKQLHYAWETVVEGDWSSHLYDVYFISETQGWAVGNSVEVTPEHDSGEGGESLIIHTDNGGQTWPQAEQWRFR